MRLLDAFLPPGDRRAALLLYGMVFSMCFDGYDAGIMTAILGDEQFTSYYRADSTKIGTIAVIPWAGKGVAQLFVGGTLCNLIGRLWTLRISIFFMCVGVMVQVVPNTYGVLLLGRIMTGLGSGCVFISTLLYTAECAPRKLRGSFVGTVSQFGYQLGTCIAFWTGYGMSFHRSPYQIAWRVSNALQIPIGIAAILLSFWYPESPRYLLERHPDQPQEALAQLAYLRSASPDDENVKEEFHEMVASYEFRRRFEPGYLGLVRTKGMRKRLAYGFYASALQQIGGIAAVTMYATLIYKSLGWNAGSQALAINGIQSVLQLFIVLVNTFTVDRFGRKALLLAGYSIQSLALLVLASLTTAFPSNNNRAAAIVEVGMLFIVGLTYCWSNGPIAPTIATEIFPQHVRDKAFGVSLMGQTVCLIAITQPWPRFNDEVGGKSYWLLFSLNVAALLSVILVLPETKGVSLERMDALFGEIDFVAAQEAEGRAVQTSSVELGPRGKEKMIASHIPFVAEDKSSDKGA